MRADLKVANNSPIARTFKKNVNTNSIVKSGLTQDVVVISKSDKNPKHITGKSSVKHLFMLFLLATALLCGCDSNSYEHVEETTETSESSDTEDTEDTDTYEDEDLPIVSDPDTDTDGTDTEDTEDTDVYDTDDTDTDTYEDEDLPIVSDPGSDLPF